jgi:hypothetical protein
MPMLGHLRMQARVIARHRDGAHHLAAAGHHDVADAAGDCLGGHRDRLQSARAESIDRRTADLDGKTGTEQREAREVESLSRLGHRAAPEDVIDLRSVQFDALGGSLHDVRAEVDRMGRGERSVLFSLADSGAHGAHDDDFFEFH